MVQLWYTERPIDDKAIAGLELILATRGHNSSSFALNEIDNEVKQVANLFSRQKSQIIIISQNKGFNDWSDTLIGIMSTRINSLVIWY